MDGGKEIPEGGIPIKLPKMVPDIPIFISAVLQCCGFMCHISIRKVATKESSEFYSVTESEDLLNDDVRLCATSPGPDEHFRLYCPTIDYLDDVKMSLDQRPSLRHIYHMLGDLMLLASKRAHYNMLTIADECHKTKITSDEFLDNLNSKDVRSIRLSDARLELCSDDVDPFKYECTATITLELGKYEYKN